MSTHPASGLAEYEDFESFSPSMSRDEFYAWFQRRLNRAPDEADIYKVAKDFFQLGAYSRAQLCLHHYVNMQGAQLMGRHLLAYCHLHLGERDKALREFKRCVKEGFHDDWQLVVELVIELERAQRLPVVAGVRVN